MLYIKGGAVMLCLFGASLKFEAGDILVGLILPLLLFWGQARSAKRRATVELLKDFQSPEFSQARGAALDFVRSQLPDESSALDSNRKLTTKLKDARRSVHTIMRFFLRLRALEHANLIDGRKAWRLFGPHFAYWWAYTFEAQARTRTDWSSKDEIEALYRWFEWHSWLGFGRRKQWVKWLDAGARQRRKDLEDYGSNFPFDQVRSAIP